MELTIPPEDEIHTGAQWSDMGITETVRIFFARKLPIDPFAVGRPWWIMLKFLPIFLFLYSPIRPHKQNSLFLRPACIKKCQREFFFVNAKMG